jgi:RNA polymerase sigma-70 factor (ECF subfamily)
MTSAEEIEAFYRATHPRLWAYLVRTTRERELAEDITQEAFVRLLASRGVDLPSSERRAYLFRIAENLVRDTARRRARERMTSLESAHEVAGDDTLAPLCGRAAAALNALSERERKLLWLAHVEGWKHSEIAGLLRLAAGSVRVLLHRARNRFRENFETKEQR